MAESKPIYMTDKLLKEKIEQAEKRVGKEIMENFDFIDDYRNEIYGLKKDKQMFDMEKLLLPSFYTETVTIIEILKQKYLKEK
jgi:hypothetical protein